VTAQHPDAANRAGVDEEVDEEGTLDDLDKRLSHLSDQRTRDLRPGRVAAGMHDAGVSVGRFAAQEQRPVERTVEGDAAGDELGDAGCALAHQHVDSGGVRQPGARGESVCGVHGGGIAGAIHTSDAALRERRATITQRAFRHECHSVPGLRRVQCRCQAGDAGADDDHAHTRAGVHARGFAASIRSSATRAGAATSTATEI
jgi:hypothetical protein